MKKILSIALICASTIVAQAQNQSWTIDKSHSHIGFGVDHMVVSETQGQFKNFEMEVKSDKADFTDAKVNITIDVNSINTDDEKRDGHLKSPDFFDVAKYPSITFVGKKLTKVKGKLYKLTGDVTMHGITKTVTLDAKFNGIVKTPMKDTRAGFLVYGELDRYAYGLKYNSIMEAGGKAIGQKVRIACSVELIKK